MDKYRVSAVSYLNTLPFIYGLKQHDFSGKIDLSLDNPAVCAEKLLTGQADIGLIPVAVIPHLRHARIISDYCIGAKGKVKSVILYSTVPLKQIKTIWLDNQSRTSVRLIRILAQNFWQISPGWEKGPPGFEKSRLKIGEAGVIIGDRAFPITEKYPYIYDLSEEWENYTGLPFVFAAWTANKKINKEFLREFNGALKYGVTHPEETVNSFSDNNYLDKTSLLAYLKNNISFSLDKEKQKGMNRFFEELNTLKTL
jgi:chorismate dehydratase